MDSSTDSHFTLMAFYELTYGELQACVDAISMTQSRNLSGRYQLMYQYVVLIAENLSVGGSWKDLNAQLKELWFSLSADTREIPFLR